jgi:hypothetical protein
MDAANNDLGIYYHACMSGGGWERKSDSPKMSTRQACKKFVWVTFQKIGYHYYPDAATRPSLADVSYLGLRHRHLFKIKVALQVFHNERDVEFHQLLNWILSLYSSGGLEFDGKSCETISDDLAAQIQTKYPNRELRIDVSEDGECGSYIEYAG